jgi:hypothetical protein
MDYAADSEREVDELAYQFFSQDSLHPLEMDLEQESALTLVPGSRRAMHVTLTMLAVSGAALAAFVVYTRVVMPVPVELGAGEAIKYPIAEQPFVPAVPPAESTHPSPPELTATLAGDEGDEPAATSSAASGDQADPQAASASSAPEPITQAPDPGAALGAAAEPTRNAQDKPHAQPSQIERAALSLAAAKRTPALVQAEPVVTTGQSVKRERPRGDDLVRRAYGSLNRGDVPGALSFARQAVVQSPKRADAWIALGSAYDAMHDRASARQAFQSCLTQAAGPFVAQCRALARD